MQSGKHRARGEHKKLTCVWVLEGRVLVVSEKASWTRRGLN